MERETKTIKTPVGGQEIVIKAWITAREKRQINSVLLNGANYTTDGEETKRGLKLDGKILSDFQDKQINEIVVSIDGVNENILEKCLELKSEDFDFLLGELENIVNPDNDKKK